MDPRLNVQLVSKNVQRVRMRMDDGLSRVYRVAAGLAGVCEHPDSLYVEPTRLLEVGRLVSLGVGHAVGDDAEGVKRGEFGLAARCGGGGC
jgi:hypothetical protein